MLSPGKRGAYAAGKNRGGRDRIRRTSVVDQVYEAVKQDILDHVWAEGDRRGP